MSAQKFLMQVDVLWLAVGVIIGVVTASVIAWRLVDRHLRRTRAAERRARSAGRMAELGAMTSGLAHEIKNPLSTIALNAQLLGEAIDELDVEEPDRGRLVRRAASLGREVERLRAILGDFLDYAGEIRLHRQPTDLNDVVGELVDFFLPQAERQGVRLRSDLPGEPVIAAIDVGQVKQAVLNLMLNATQAMSTAADRGTQAELIMRTERVVDEDHVEHAVLHVTDTGPGMDPQTVARIFEPYFTTRSGGTGLGLPTARRLVEQHGGRIDVHSEPGRGTDFALYFPVSVPDSPPEEP